MVNCTVTCDRCGSVMKVDRHGDIEDSVEVISLCLSIAGGKWNVKDWTKAIIETSTAWDLCIKCFDSVKSACFGAAYQTIDGFNK